MTGRVRESDLVIPALRIMSEQPGGFITTTQLIQELEEVFNPKGDDAQFLDGRNDTYFSQKVRNLISHRSQSNNFIHKGYAEYLADREGLKITQLGEALLEQISG